MHKQLISLDGIKKEFRFLNTISQKNEFTKYVLHNQYNYYCCYVPHRYNTSLLNMDFMQQSLQNHSDYLVCSLKYCNSYELML